MEHILKASPTNLRKVRERVDISVDEIISMLFESSPVVASTIFEQAVEDSKIKKT